MLFYSKPMIKQEHIEKIKDFLKRKKIKEAYIFGSMARGDAGQRSDLDLIVVMETDKPFFQRYEEFKELILNLPLPVDLLIYTPEEWQEIKERLFFRQILKEAKRIA